MSKKQRVKRKEMSPIQKHRFGTILQSIKVYVDKFAHINYNSNGEPYIKYSMPLTGRRGGSRRKDMPEMGEAEVNRIFEERYS